MLKLSLQFFGNVTDEDVIYVYMTSPNGVTLATSGTHIPKNIRIVNSIETNDETVVDDDLISVALDDFIRVYMTSYDGVTLATAGKYCPKNIRVIPSFEDVGDNVFILQDGLILVTADGQTFLTKG